MARIISEVVSANIDHNNLADLTVGDDHTQYALLAGRSGGQTLIGGTGASDNLDLKGTSNATQGKIRILGSGGAAIFAINNSTAGKSAFILQSNGTQHAIFSLSGFWQGDATTNVVFAAETGDVIKFYTNGDANSVVTFGLTGILSIDKAAGYIDLSAISAGSPNLKITKTTDTPAGTPAGYMEVIVGSTPHYIQLYT